jgi:hypothetical protein
MALEDLAARKARKGPPCSVCLELQTLPPAEAAGLVTLLSNPRLRYSEISRMIAHDPDTPLHIEGTTLARHSRGDCSAHTRLR